VAEFFTKNRVDQDSKGWETRKW